MSSRIATLQTVQPEALRELEDVMQRKFKANTSLRASQVGGVTAAAKIMNFTKQAMEARIMNALKDDDEDPMVAIQESMFVFDNLIMSDDKSLQTLLRSVDTEDLVLALKGADEPLRDKLFSYVVARRRKPAGRNGSAWPGSPDGGTGSSERIINVARRMSDEGSIVLAGQAETTSSRLGDSVMSSGTPSSDRLTEALDLVVAEMPSRGALMTPRFSASGCCGMPPSTLGTRAGEDG